MIILSEVSQTEKDKFHNDITDMWSLKYDANERIYETETEAQTQRADLWLPRGRGWGRFRSSGLTDVSKPGNNPMSISR